jgi:hypothetical protein
MAGLEIRESVTVAGRAELVRVARAFAVGVLGPGHPCGDDAALLVSELFGNSVRHSRSGPAGGTVTVAVRVGDGTVLSGWRSPIAAALRCRSCTVLAGMRNAAGGFSSLRASRRGGGGGGVAGGR